MNVFLFELKSQTRTFVIWTSVILFNLILFIKGIYPVFYAAVDEVLAMLSGFPPEFSAAFHVTDDMFTYSGFYCFTYMYIVLIGAIMAAVLSISSFAREKRNKCADFLLTKPVERRNIFFAKLLSSMLLLFAAGVLFAAVSVLLYLSDNPGGGQTAQYLIASAGLFFTQMIFIAAGIFYAVFAKRVRSVAGSATAFGFGAFILSALVNILDKELFFLISPLSYFNPAAVFAGGTHEFKYIAAAVIAIAGMVWASYFKYTGSDIHAA
ncbi:MAG: ABC transporter permease subunit [Eubacteriales bacterium]|nr:ABC transporter permease subunit [Eubacteriales bacterium]